MGRDAYLTLLTLGRHCYEPQSREAPSTNNLGDSPDNNNSDPPSATTPENAPSSQTPNSSSSNPYYDTQRALRKAQNDVVTTVGVELNKKGRTSRKSAQNAEQERENDVGLFLGAVDVASIYFMTWPLIGIRNELQVHFPRAPTM